MQLTAGYGKEPVLHELVLEIHPGERLGLIGTSGAGKSTLLLALLGLLRWRGGWARGEVLFQGQNLLQLKERDARRLRGRAVALVPQNPLGALNGALSLQKHFRAVWCAHLPWDAAAWTTRVQDLLRRVRLPSHPSFLQRKPGQISIGQAQRCAIALALLHRPALLIADEPTSALDPVTQLEVLELLQEVTQEQGTALLFVSHDLLSVLRLCQMVSFLDGGRIAESLPLQQLARASHPALRQLLRTLPAPPDVVLREMLSATADDPSAALPYA